MATCEAYGSESNRLASNKYSETIQQIREQSKDINRKIEETSQEIISIQAEEKDVIDQLNDTDISINQLKQLLADSKRELNSLEKEIQTILAQSKDIQREIKTVEAYAMKRMVALYKLTSVGKMMYLTSAGSICEVISQKKALNRILTNDEQLLEQFAQKIEEFNRLQNRLNEIKKQKHEMETEYLKKLEEISYQKSQRSKLLSDIRSKKNLMLASIDSLKTAANELNQKIIEMQKPTESSSMESIKESSSDMKIPLKSLQNLPVKGKIISFFGPYKNPEFNVMNFQSGIDIRAERGEPVRSAESGVVLYSSWFKGYGNMIILDHENGYYTVYAYLEDIFTKKDARVLKGDVIGTVGDSGSMIGPALHFEVRYHGKPIDPVKWLKKGVSG